MGDTKFFIGSGQGALENKKPVAGNATGFGFVT
jgi:hypothetical protein